MNHMNSRTILDFSISNTLIILLENPTLEDQLNLMSLQSSLFFTEQFQVSDAPIGRNLDAEIFGRQMLDLYLDLLGHYKLYKSESLIIK